MGGKVKGPINAPLKIQEFSDFQCPACQKGRDTLEELWKKYPDKVRLTFFHFPLMMHPWAMTAHQCAECAYLQGKFWPYHDLLFSRQKEWSEGKDPKTLFIRYAKELGLDVQRFQKCLELNETKSAVVEDVRRGNEVQVQSTPTFILNGRRVPGGKLLAENLEKMIQEELTK